MKQNDRHYYSLKWYHSRACFSCYCDTCDTCEKVVGLFLKSINTKGRRSEFNAKLHGHLTERKQTMPTGCQGDEQIGLPGDL